MTRYAVIFETNPPSICGGYESLQQVRDSPCFPQPTELHDRFGWHLMDEQVTKLICGTTTTITGRIATRSD